MLENLTRASFEPYLNTRFTVTRGVSKTLELELVEVADKTPARFEGEQFSLIFLGPTEPELLQQIYRLEHADMGNIDLFLVPVGREASGRFYEAFFNRSVKPEG